MQIFKEAINRKHINVLQEIPNVITFKPGEPATHHFYSGRDECFATCLGCADAPCMNFHEDEIKCAEVSMFAGDKSIATCPVDALRWDSDSGRPIIDNKKCVLCGICMRRCPVGAIFFDKGKVLIYSGDDNVHQLKADKDSVSQQFEQLATITNKPRGGVLINESDDLMDAIYSKLFKLSNNYHNSIGRNLLISLGCNSSMRRIGDVYTRMDAVYSSSDGCFGAVEVEFGRDTLDASRGILDDIAVLFTRYKIAKSNNCPLVICLQLPNARQGYWQVVKDISVVEGIRINTLTVGALMILNWNGCSFEPSINDYYIDYDNMLLRNAMEIQLDGPVHISNKKLGILEPMK